MSKAFWNLLEDTAQPGELEKLSPSLKHKLQTLSEELSLILSISNSAAKSEILSKLCAEVLSHLGDLEDAVQKASPKNNGDSRFGVPTQMGSGSQSIQPAILEWARQQVNEEVTVAGLREIRESGGVQLEDFLPDLEREATPLD